MGLEPNLECSITGAAGLFCSYLKSDKDVQALINNSKCVNILFYLLSRDV